MTRLVLYFLFVTRLSQEDNPSQYLMDFVHENHYAPPAIGESLFPDLQAHNVWQREHVMRRQVCQVSPFDLCSSSKPSPQVMETPSNHHPEVYALPRDHDVVQQQNLTPCEDLAFLLDKFRRDVSSLTGVPHEMIMGRESGHETVRKTLASGRIFSTNMNDICRCTPFHFGKRFTGMTPCSQAPPCPPAGRLLRGLLGQA